MTLPVESPWECAAASRSSATSRCRCRGRAAATASTARSRRTSAHLHEPDEVERADRPRGAAPHVKELLVLTGEHPEVNAEVAARLARVRPRGLHLLRRLGLRARAGARAAAAHEPRRALARGPGAAARGDRIAGPDARVGLRAADGDRARGLADEAPGAADRRRSRAAGELRIPFTSGILVGIGETEEERMAALEALAAVHARARPPPGGDPPELRARTRRYYGRGAGGDRRRAAREYWRTGIAARPAARRCPAWACEVTIEDMKRLDRRAPAS